MSDIVRVIICTFAENIGDCKIIVVNEYRRFGIYIQASNHGGGD